MVIKKDMDSSIIVIIVLSIVFVGVSIFCVIYALKYKRLKESFTTLSTKENEDNYMGSGYFPNSEEYKSMLYDSP